MTAIHEYMDIKYFLPVTYEQSKGRRESRPPYALKDGGVWQDPPRYFDKIVWPNYVEEHRWMFENGDVNGRVKSDTMREKGIRAHIDRGLDLDMETTLKWAVESLITDLTDLLTE
jgi:nicotinamide/nicotinate riboside kinase